MVEFEPNRLISWESMGCWRGHKVVGGQRWRYRLRPGTAGTEVTHSYLWGYATLALLTVRLPGFPARMAPAMEQSLARLDLAVTPQR